MRTPTQISRPPANAPRYSPSVGLQKQHPVNNTPGAQSSSNTPHNNRYLQGVQGSTSMHRQNSVEKDERTVRPSIAGVDRKSARRLPLSWLSIVPECKIYNKLVSMETTLEQSRIQKLREWSNTRQPGSADDPSGSSGSLGPPAWSLYVVGKILGENLIEIELPDNVFGKDSKYVWNANDDTQSGNVVELTRFSDDSLTDFFGIQTGSKQEFVRAFWNYVKSRKLHDPDDITKIRFEEELRTIFRQESIKFTEISSLIERWLVPVGHPPVKMSHRVRLSGKQLHSTAMDVSVRVGGLSSKLLNFNDEINALDASIQEIFTKMAQAKRKRDFMQALSQSPVEFLQMVIKGHKQDIVDLRNCQILQLPEAGIQAAELLPDERLCEIFSSFTSISSSNKFRSGIDDNFTPTTFRGGEHGGKAAESG
ncbi:hypothetical protein GUITHDRAFT_136391 [Guillardia theta CCMP2712]|uniref:DM2 domain-containing protein n=1 Tax=Guillardia theta (strain CCMP2712) TaxID=905079 RepID=L1JJL8_GUITC|nr:hypothetical protein GUITHDRAFT_136391 [Guillardia theta CCMP2712]EKX48696.1 hypothetical protein GUITHDRAFT_136391 [Guillardia theta CCMP2712]|eukprot:XP_005835676.1 hypothetical protein GUITHDRAFT_136391 [Guillardia theta CCMP2712]